MVRFHCSKCKVIFRITELIIDIEKMCFLEEFGGGGIHCPCCRDDNSVAVVI